MKTVQAVFIDEISFDDAWGLQKKIHHSIHKSGLSNTVLFLQHPHTFTIGKTGKMEHLLLAESELKKDKIYFSKIDRGGDITYHGPGQFVVYPILKLEGNERDLHKYLRKLEDLVIVFLKNYKISANRIDGLTGVWVDNKKIAAIGIKMSRWISMHGLAININTDLNYFNKIIPCGISDKKVCSLSSILGKNYEVDEIKNNFYTAFKEVFSVDLHFISYNEIKKQVEL
jgi:lipoyl(octanoyl) transferase